jgi:hypothetical protein
MGLVFVSSIKRNIADEVRISEAFAPMPSGGLMRRKGTAK